MFGFIKNSSCPNCYRPRLKKIHRLPWMKKLSNSVLFKCNDCDHNFLFWEPFYLEIKKFKKNKEIVSRS
jgi:hypothetical protein